MKITNFSIHHATAVFVLIAVIVIGGVRAYDSLPKEASPDVQIPIVIVQTAYFGVSPSDIETLVTRQLEEELDGLRNVDKMTSTSADSVSLITIEFDPSIDIDNALQKVREKVDKAEGDLPDDAEDPEIIEINASDWPVLIANVSGEADPVRLQSIGEDIQEDIEGIQGVLRVELAGGVDREVQVAVDPEALRHHKVSLGQINRAIRAENINLPGGSIDVGSQKFTVRVPGEFERVQALEEIVVKSTDGQVVMLKDVADVQWGFEARDTYSRLTTWTRHDDGELKPISKPNISLSVVKRAGENILRISREAKEVLDQYRDRFEKAGVEITVINDNSEMIKTRVKELENNIISGLLLVLITLFFFMGGARNALFVAISIPTSMLLTFLVLQMLGVTLNMVVLFSLVLALGMLVDNAIVVVENIYRHVNEGKTRVQAAIDGTKEVGWAITASTATTVGAFFPLLFWPGVMGEFMGYLPMTVIIVLLSSLFVALVINPTLCSKFIKPSDDVQLDEAEVPDNALYRHFRTLLEWALHLRFVVLLGTIGILVGSIMLFAANDQGVELFPETTPDKFNVTTELPDGTRLEATGEVVEALEKPLDQRPELVEAWVSNIGTKGSRQQGGGEAPHYGNISVDLVEVEDQTSDPATFIQKLRDVYEEIPGANISVKKASMGPPTGPPIGIEIVGEDLTTLQSISDRVKRTLRTIPGVIDVDDDLELTRPEIHVDVDRKQAALAGINTRKIASTVRTAISGTEASVFRDAEEEYDITVQLDQAHRRDIQDIRQLTVTDRRNRHIPLTELAEVRVRGGSGSIHHRDRERVVTVTAKAAEGYLAADRLERAQAELADLDVPTGYDIRYTGENEDRQEASDFLAGALMAAVFIIALILVTEFNSVVQPLIILLSVTLSLIGVFWSLLITGEPFGIIMTGIGIISLAGVVVNNSIVMVDYINVLRERGYERREAVIRGGMVRLRPVVLTAVTTALGLLPIVIGVSLDFVNFDIVVGGNSVELWGPMSRVVVAGLMVATVLTLVVVPVMYSIFDDIGAIPGKVADWMSSSGVALLAAGLGVALAGSPTSVRAQDDTSSSVSEAYARSMDDTSQTTDATSEASKDNTDDSESVSVDPVEPGIEAARTLTLSEARDLVREQNYDVKLAATRVDEAASSIQQAYSILFPNVSASGSYIIHDQEITTSFGPSDGGGGQLPEGVDTEILIQPKTEYRWNLAANIRLINARAIPLIKQAYKRKELADKQVEVLRDELDFAAIRLYYNLLTVRRVVELSAEQLEARRRERRTNQKRLDRGVINQFEMTRSKLRVVQAEKELERARLQFEKVRESLAQLLQTEADFDLERPDAPRVDRSPNELVEVAADRRLELEARELDIELAERRIDEVYTQYLPTIGATFSLIGTRTTDFNPDPFKWQASLNANWTIWDGGGREAMLDRRRAQQIASELEQDKKLSEIETNLRKAWSDYESARSQVESGENEVELARQTLEETRRAHRRGVATQLDLIRAEDQVRSAEITLVRDRLELHLAARKLQHLAGLN